MSMFATHLRVHTEYALNDGLMSPEDVVQQAVDQGMSAVAISDPYLFGAVKLFEAAKAKNIVPIIGAELKVKDHPSMTSSVLVFCQNQQGYKNLCQWLSKSCLDAHGEISFEDLIADDHSGILVLSGFQRSAIGKLLLENEHEKALALCQKWQAAFGDRFYLELQRYDDPVSVGVTSSGHRFLSEELTLRTLDLAVIADAPVIATHPVQFAQAEDFEAHEAKVCIASGQLLNDFRREVLFSADQYFVDRANMSERFADIPAALANLENFIQRIGFIFVTGTAFFPIFPTPENHSLEQYLHLLAYEGLNKRMSSFSEEQKPAYFSRLDFELEVITNMGFCGYFLVVSDVIAWAKNNDVPVGPGRGSGAGSLVAWALGMADMDPLAHGLLFERFLNPKRISLPDFDVDFCQDKRHLVIEYVIKKYGRSAVSQIATFGSMAPKAVVRDVGRVLGMNLGFVDKLSKMIPNELEITLAKALEKEPALAAKKRDEADVAELFNIAFKLEGKTRSVGTHAGGVLLAPNKITDFCPLYRKEGSSDEDLVSQFDMKDIEKVGLVKFDFLGLKTLSVIAASVKSIRENKNPDFNIATIGVDDAATYALFTRGETVAVFQCESATAQDIGRKMKPSVFADLVALVALNRPGPLNSGMVDQFIDRKHGRKEIDYSHNSLRDILGETYGVIVYQEQVMQIAQTLCGFDLSQADILRRAMGKKDAKSMAEQEQSFIDSAVARQVDEKIARHLFSQIKEFAEYGFNKSHSCAYAFLTWQTAYLKCHYPAHFMAATLSYEMGDTDRVNFMIRECRKMGLKILPPDIQNGQWHFYAEGDQQLRYGLGAIKGLGQAAVDQIIEERDRNGKFLSFKDFCQRIDKKSVNKRALEAMIKGGCFDALDMSRASALAYLPSYLEKDFSGGMSLFGEDEAAIADKPLPEWPEEERLKQEKIALGFYLSGHPYTSYKEEFSDVVEVIAEISAKRKRWVQIAGLVESVRRIRMKNDRSLIVAQLSDGSGDIEVVFNDTPKMAPYRECVVEDALLVVGGFVSLDRRGSGRLRFDLQRATDLRQLRQKLRPVLRLELTEAAAVAPLSQALASHPGPTVVVVLLRLDDLAGEVVLAPTVNPDTELLQQLASISGIVSPKLSYSLEGLWDSPPEPADIGGDDRLEPEQLELSPAELL